MSSVSLPVIIPRIEGQNWSCQSCGDCCRSLVGHVTLEERARIEDYGWEQRLGIAPVVRAGSSWALNKHADGSCVFLSEDNRCRIHSELGESSKPLACRVFPFSVRRTGRGWQASLRFDCPSVTSNQGMALGTHRRWLDQLVGELADQSPRAEERVELAPGLLAEHLEIEAMDTNIISWFDQNAVSMTKLLVGAGRLLCLLAQAKLRSVRGERFADLLDILTQTIRAELPREIDPQPPAARQRGMLRQSVLAHVEHVTLTQLRSGVPGRFGQKLRQLKSARAMLSGHGRVPELQGIRTDTSFDQVERVLEAQADSVRIEGLLRRYLLARIASRSIYGEGYYGWSILHGYAALMMSVAAAGWLARLLAAADRVDRIRFQDASTALGMVDRAATRLPALGTWTERRRIDYFLMDEGLMRLSARFAMT